MSEENPSQFTIKVSYNGVQRLIAVNGHQAIQAVLQHALNEFGIRQDRNNFGLFTERGEELNTQSMVQDAQISDGVLLLLRPRQSRGG